LLTFQHTQIPTYTVYMYQYYYLWDTIITYSLFNLTALSSVKPHLSKISEKLRPATVGYILTILYHPEQVVYMNTLRLVRSTLIHCNNIEMLLPHTAIIFIIFYQSIQKHSLCFVVHDYILQLNARKSFKTFTFLLIHLSIFSRFHFSCLEVFLRFIFSLELHICTWNI
jgi:hypothetical protein